MKKRLNFSSKIKCRICLTGKQALKYKFNDYNLYQCANCGFEYIENPPTNKEILAYYSEKDYEDPVFAEKRITDDSIRSLNIIDRCYSGKKEIFDVGCGRGIFLKQAQIRGWKTFGLDYSKEAIKYAREVLNLDVINADIVKFSSIKKYNIISLNQIIEHFEDPQLLIEKVKNLLEPHGYVYIATPNISSLSAKYNGINFDYYIPPEHLSLFNYNCLSLLLKSVDFKIVYHGTWSYKEEFAGVVKAFIKGKNIKKRLNTEKNTPTISKSTNERVNNTKYLIFDNIFCSAFYPVLNFTKSGSMLEIIAQKNE